MTVREVGFCAVPHRGLWSVRGIGAYRSRRVGLSREDAWLEACRLARGVRGLAYLFGADGRIVARNGYGKTAASGPGSS